jgi:medium-chain acyl-[acyl-carrier-protein] hydrolase
MIDQRLVQTRHDPQARVHLFCFPHAGGGAAPYYAWSRELPSHIQVCPIHLPGRENRLSEPPFTRMADLVAELVEGLMRWPAGRFAFFGHSLGGLMAYEVAQALAGQREPVHLFVSAARAPGVGRRSQPFAHLPDAGFLAAVQSRYQPLPAAVLHDPEVLSLFLPALRGDFTLFDAYQATIHEPLSIPVSAFGGEEDEEVKEGDLAPWAGQTRGAFCLRLYPGGHFFLKAQQKGLLEAIASDLAGAAD